MKYIVLRKKMEIWYFQSGLQTKKKLIADSYARMHSLSLGVAFKQALFEKIEDEYDIVVAEEAHTEYVNSGKKSRPISELWKELDI